MTAPPEPASPAPAPGPAPRHRTSPWSVLGWLALAAAVLGLMAVGVALLRGAGPTRLLSVGKPAPPRVTHEVVVQQLRDVAQLATSEVTLRDVVVYRQTRFGSTKQALLVVTGRVLAGIDLERADVRIDHDARRITVSLPPARIISVDVTDVRTYDERAGLLNPFRPADRDAIQREARARIERAARETGLLARADESANELLRRFLSRDGYTVEISRPPVVRRAG